jgi:hypothetical protein
MKPVPWSSISLRILNLQSGLSRQFTIEAEGVSRGGSFCRDFALLLLDSFEGLQLSVVNRHLGNVAGVDVDVFVAEIASPDSS